MSFFLGQKPKTRGYRQAYREEFKKQGAAELKAKVRADVKRDRTPKSERIKAQARGDFEKIEGKRKALYYNIGGSINIRKDALSRLKKLGKR